jgi:pimeloyl-ACP methyl ester carboxylesterase
MLVLALIAGCTSTGGSQQGRSSAGGATGGSASPGPSGTAADARSGGTTIAFRPCPGEAKKVLGTVPHGMQIDCGSLAVPLSWQQPGRGGRLHLAVVRLHSDHQRNRIGSLLMNPGGPGVSAIEFAIGLGVRVPALSKRFDIIGFDPRGVGESDPVRCMSPAEKDREVALSPDPRVGSQFTAQVRLAEQIASGCRQRYGNRLRYFSTLETARDMDAVRAALGDAKLSYLGFSYGTLLGAVYATLFPHHVRVLALDGAVDPTADATQQAKQQAAGFEEAFGQFAAWCRENADQCPIGSDPSQTVQRLLAQARAHPIPSRQPGETRRATDGNVLLAVIRALYDERYWPVLARSIDFARHGDSEGVLYLDDLYTERRSSGTFSNLLDANAVISCADDAHRIAVGRIRQLAESWQRQYPLFGGATGLELLPCAEWKAPADPAPTVSAPSSPPIVVVGSRNDPATPYQSAVALTRQLRSAVLITAQGEGHTSYEFNACVRRDVNAYLIDRTVPKKGTVCPAG